MSGTRYVFYSSRDRCTTAMSVDRLKGERHGSDHPGFFEDLIGFLTQPFFLFVYACIPAYCIFMWFSNPWHERRLEQARLEQDKPADPWIALYAPKNPPGCPCGGRGDFSCLAPS